MDSHGEITTKLSAHLADLPGGIGCRHLARQRDRFNAGILVSLSLVKPIVSRVPRCVDHGCPLIPTCDHAADFEPEASGSKAGVKYRPTPDGLAAAADAALIESATVTLPAAADILNLLASGPMTIFELETRLRAAWSAPGKPPDRPELGQLIAILVGLGRVRLDDGIALVRLLETG
ncbi:MAG TPA: hypothetical protein VGR16_10105 [Thermomicrobiales bacterium]|nr:hypothetical protein [Thermomicrobiales bacterium]